MNFKRTSCAVLTAFALVALAACSSDDNGSKETTDKTVDTTPASVNEALPELTTGGSWTAPGITVDAKDLRCGQTATNPNRGVTATSIKVGGLLTKSGPTTALYTDSEAGAKARFERANAEGGVNGRTIDFIGAEDDGMESNRQVDAARKLINEDVFAVVPLLSAIPSFQDVFCDAAMPHFGWAFTAAWCNDTLGFAITGCLVNPDPKYNSIAVGAIAKALEGTDQTIAIIGNEDEAAKLGVAKTKEALARYDIKTVYDESVLSPTTPLADPSQIVNKITTSNGGQAPAMVYMITDFSNTSTLTQALKASGYEGILLNAVGYDPRLAQFEGFDGSNTNLQWAPFEATGIPFVDQMNADFDQYASEANRGLPAAAGYISADMFLQAVKDTGQNLTVDSFLKTMNADWVYSTPNFRGDAKYPDNHVFGVPCANLVELSDQAYSQATPVTCNEVFIR